MACRVGEHPKRTHLYLRLWWRGRETWERTEKTKTNANRDELGRIADLITAEIQARRFTLERYLHYFPNGRRREELEADAPREQEPPASSAPIAPTIADYYAEWIERQRPPLVRPAQQRDYRQHFGSYLCTASLSEAATLGTLRLDEIKPRIWLQVRDYLLGLNLKPKTVKNILGSLRALVLDARERTDFVSGAPFATMKWPRTPSAEPDPFDAAERDRIVEWFRNHKRHYYPFVLTLFRTGMRPSEATALRWSDVDLARGTIRVRRSRYQGAENEPKTRGSNRTVYAVTAVLEALRAAMPLHARSDDYVFVNAWTGGPIDQGEWAREFWHRPLRALNIRTRKFYATRHTFISIALTQGVNMKWLAEQCGNSVAMIEHHYGRFLGGEVEAQVRLLEGDAQQAPSGDRRGRRGAKPVTVTGRRLVGGEKVWRNKVVPFAKHSNRCAGALRRPDPRVRSVSQVPADRSAGTAAFAAGPE
jgi:integrase